MSFWKNAFVFASGTIVGAAALTAFTGYQAFKLLKKNDILYSAVEESVKAGVHTGGNELGNRLAKMATDKIFDQPSCYPKSYARKAYQKPPVYDVPVYGTRFDAENALRIMNDIIEQSGHATIADLYDTAGVTHISYSFNKYGWTKLGDVMVVLTTLGYTLTLPQARPV